MRWCRGRPAHRARALRPLPHPLRGDLVRCPPASFGATETLSFSLSTPPSSRLSTWGSIISPSRPSTWSTSRGCWPADRPGDRRSNRRPRWQCHATLRHRSRTSRRAFSSEVAPRGYPLAKVLPLQSRRVIGLVWSPHEALPPTEQLLRKLVHFDKAWTGCSGYLAVQSRRNLRERVDLRGVRQHRPFASGLSL